MAELQKEQHLSGKAVAIGISLFLLVVVAGLIWYAWPKPRKTLEPSIRTDTGDMLLIPAGRCVYGKDRAVVILPDYYIDRTEVTNAAYKKFCDATQHPLPGGLPTEPSKANDPVVSVSYLDAEAFAKWAHKRLPTAEEWEKAARGVDGRLYPWGDNPDASKANVRENPAAPVPGLVSVDRFPQGASPFGTLNMAGNAFEFVNEKVTPSAAAVEQIARNWQPQLGDVPTGREQWCAVKGGSFRSSIRFAVAYEYVALPARYRSPDIGFRCVRNVPQ